MKIIYFATSNPAKAAEAQDALKPYGIKVKHINATKPEAQDEPIEKIAADGAKFLARKLRKPIVVEDTGVFFDAFPGFPGPLAKPIMTHLKIKGILQLLRGKKRGAQMKTAVAYCEPGREPRVFIGEVKGNVPQRPLGRYTPHIPYDVIFIPRGHKKSFAQEPGIKKTLSHRTKAFSKLGKWLSK